MNWYLDVLKKYAVFDGRARRQEFWMFVLINFVISVALNVVDRVLSIGFFSGAGILGTLYGLAVLIPSLALAWRRLHDTDKSGWWILIGLIPLVGWIILIVFYATEGNRGPNRFGPDPKEAAAPSSWTQGSANRGSWAQGPGGAGGTGPLPAVGWYPDPSGRHESRYWDGRVWTTHVSDRGVTSEDAVG